MHQIINFVIRLKNFLLFIFLFSIGIILTIQSHAYHKSKFINSANFISGSVYNFSNTISTYFNLKATNSLLLEENNFLKTVLYNQNQQIPPLNVIDTSLNYKFTPALVIKNSYSTINNYLNLNVGNKQGIEEDTGVITSLGIVGIIDKTSNSYSRVLSILNSKSKLNAMHKKTNHFGVLHWNGEDPNIVQLSDMPKQTPLAIGDTIVTGNLSTIFPKGLPIGKIVNYKLDDTENYQILNIKLFNDMTSLNHVYIIKNKDANEINTLNLIDNE